MSDIEEPDTMNIALWCTFCHPLRIAANYVYKGNTMCMGHFREEFTKDFDD